MTSFEAPPADPAAVQVAEVALDMVGAPYRWGGETPDGFDCSGLVYYAFGRAGMDVPRTSVEQHKSARLIALSEAQPGDLVFFREAWTVSHVGIYVGEGRFVHAPNHGRPVQVSSMEEDYYRARFAGAGRLLLQ